MLGDNLEYLVFVEDDILERVDEYALYCHFLNEEVLINGTSKSPFREDTHPSFSVYERTKTKGSSEFMWKDKGKGWIGDIFDLVQRMYGYSTRRKAMIRVMGDFGIGGAASDSQSQVTYFSPIRKYLDPIDIAVKSRPFTPADLLFWNGVNISLPILQQYHCNALKHYWLTLTQKYPTFCKVPTYSYQIYNKYQLYAPSAERSRKFRNDCTEDCLMGLEQLSSNKELLIITKSMKDIMCLRSYGYDAISPTFGENTIVPRHFLDQFKQEYKRILVLFDNDGKHRASDYEFDKIWIPKMMETDKDTSDFTRNHGPHETADMLKQIIGI